MADDSPRASDLPFLRRALIVVGVGALVAAVWILSDVLLLVFGSVLIAVTLRALAAPLSAHFGLGERWALAIVGVLLLSAVTAAVLLFGADLSVQMRGLSEQLSAAVKMLGERLQMDSLADLLKGENPATSIGAIVARVFAWSATLPGVLAGLLLVLITPGTCCPLGRGIGGERVPIPVGIGECEALSVAHATLGAQGEPYGVCERRAATAVEPCCSLRLVDKLPQSEMAAVAEDDRPRHGHREVELEEARERRHRRRLVVGAHQIERRALGRAQLPQRLHSDVLRCLPGDEL
jgi:hypothetical protein